MKVTCSSQKVQENLDVIGEKHNQAIFDLKTEMSPKDTLEVIKKRSKMASLACLKARKFMNLGYRRDRLDMT